LEVNEYAKKKDYVNFQITDNFIPSNKQELINSLYTILDSGVKSFAFYPSEEYTDFDNDLKSILDEDILNVMNNYVHPYNSFTKFNISTDSFNIIRIEISKLYNEFEIAAIELKMDLTINTIINSQNTYDKIRSFHDYIINTTTYDTKEAEYIENGTVTNVVSNKAYSVLINGKGICGGYTDTMAIFLNKLGIDNFKISTNGHTWNVVNLNGYKHIDVTWDDPVTISGANLCLYDYFMLTTDELLNTDITKHNFNKNIYKELAY